MNDADHDGEYYVEVLAQGGWSRNGLYFKTEEEAEGYAKDLALRWTAVEDWRVCRIPSRCT